MLKPNLTSYFFTRLIRTVIALFFIGITALILTPFLGPAGFIFPLLIAFPFLFLYLIGSYISYRKENYYFDENKLTRNFGGIFSSNKTELLIKNITHVYVVHPYIQSKLFGTGDIHVESAGSNFSELVLSSVENPEDLYQQIKQLMEQNGFNLEKSSLIRQDKPAISGVVLETGGRFIGGLISFFITVLWIGGAFFSELNSETLPVTLPIIGGIFLLIMGYGFIRSIFLFLDLKQRVYLVYSNVLEYEEGFLSRKSAFIPMQNLADSSLTQNFIQRVLGIYDIVLSCQGSGQEILFKNIIDGESMDHQLDELIDNQKKMSAVTSNASKITAVNAEEKSEKDETTISHGQVYKKDVARTLTQTFIFLPFSIIIFPLLPAWFIAAFWSIVSVFRTEYRLGRQSVEEQFDFFNKVNRRFTTDKITAVVVKENPLDSFFNTYTIELRSIGSSQNITLQNIKKETNILNTVLEGKKIPIENTVAIKTLSSDFSIASYIFSSIYKITFGLILVVLLFIPAAVYNPWLSLLVVIPIIAIFTDFIYKHYYYQTLKIKYYRNHIEFTQGLLRKVAWYVKYEDIKGITTTRYPIVGTGEIEFNIAGEILIQGGKTPTILSNSFKVKHITAAEDLADEADQILISDDFSTTKFKEHKLLISSSPDPRNHILSSVVIFPLLPFLPFTLISLLFTEYIVEDYRVILKQGVIYKRRSSILFNKIDFINLSQGPTGKLFNNGHIVIHTIGSSAPELVLNDVKNHKALYETLNSNYK